MILSVAAAHIWNSLLKCRLSNKSFRHFNIISKPYFSDLLYTSTLVAFVVTFITLATLKHLN